jgi:hypothetical protein
VTIDPRHRILSALAVVTALLLAMLIGATVSQATAGTRAHKAAAGRIGVGTAHSLGSAGRCSRRIAPARTKRLTQPRRHRLARLLRSCRRRLATESSGPHNPLYWGATVGDQITGTQAPWDMNAISQFEALGGKQLSLVNFFAPFANCSSSPCSFYKFPTGPMESIRTHGAIPVFSWSSQSIPSSSSEPDFQLADVVSGRYDSYIREFAEDAHDWGHPFFLRFNWEMNGNWFPWSESINGNQPGEYVAAWRHVHDIFTSVGATNATWVWCPNIDPGAKLQAVDSLYPGNEYVDWTGLDGYNWGPKKGGWTSFDRLYRSSYDAITETVAPGKPLMIAEVGSTETGGSKANWVSEALTAIPTEYPMVRGLLWFDKFDDGMDWPIETSSSATEAFANGIENSAYLTNSYENLSASPIPPPS